MMKMKKQVCQPETVYESASVMIQFCPDCKMVHLNMGALTIRMTQSEFAQFSQDMSNGVFEYRAHQEGRQSLRMLM
jgi:Zn-finger nucleic acid-binding protein